MGTEKTDGGRLWQTFSVSRTVTTTVTVAVPAEPDKGEADPDVIERAIEDPRVQGTLRLLAQEDEYADYEGPYTADLDEGVPAHVAENALEGFLAKAGHFVYLPDAGRLTGSYHMATS